MRLGFVSAIVPELSLAEVLELAASCGYDCVELMCWPPGKAERRYAGVTHVELPLTSESGKVVERVVRDTGISISGLGYYPNPLSPDGEESRAAVAHLEHVIRGAADLGIGVVNTFVGRDWTRSIDDNWPAFRDTWKPLVRLAAEHDVRIGIENCPMLFTGDEWPGGKNLAISPSIWRRMFEEIPDAHFGLNFDPSHLVWQHIDYTRPLREFADRLVHVHAKDARVDRERLDDVGILATPLEYHAPKLPGLGDVDWGRFFSVLTDVGYDGAVCVEVEDRAYERTLDTRRAALEQSARYLRQFIA